MLKLVMAAVVAGTIGTSANAGLNAASCAAVGSVVFNLARARDSGVDKQTLIRLLSEVPESTDGGQAALAVVLDMVTIVYNSPQLTPATMQDIAFATCRQN